MRILGIDPGTSRIGYGFIESDGLKLIAYGVIEAKEKEFSEKISTFSGRLNKLIENYKPGMAAIEKIYFVKNQKTGIDVAQARGVILSIFIQKGLKFVEYSPNEVKSQVTGYGLADKKAVAKMVKIMLKIKELTGYDDASDALAIAITAANHRLLTDKTAAI